MITFSLTAFWSNPSSGSVPTKINQFAEGEKIIYQRLIESYHHNKLADVLRWRQVLERNYPKSIHLDEAYYLTGMTEFQNNRLGEALKSFDVVRDRFATSNKRAGALFATGATYQRLNLPKQAHRVFDQIMKEYPGSPESQRAWMQLRVENELRTPVKSANKKKR